MTQVADKSARQEASEEDVDRFRRNLGPFVVAAETTRMAMVFTDATEPGNPIIFVNDSCLALTGFSREEVLGQSFNFFMSRGADARSLAHVEATFAGDVTDGIEMSYRCKDGRLFCSAILISPVRDERGDIVQHFASFVDLTAHRQEQARSALLIGELNHRVKNTLATVQSIVAQAFRNGAPPDIVQEAIEARLAALSGSHDLLTRESWVSAGLLDLVTVALQPFGIANGLSERFAIAGENTRLGPNAVLAFGIAFHELATNAVKYGALSNQHGFVEISWTVRTGVEGDRVFLRWQERNGPPVTPPTKKGFGSRVIERGLGHELGAAARLDYQAAGVLCTIDFLSSRGDLNG